MFKSSYQGGPYVEVFSAQGKDPAAKWKQSGRVQRIFDKGVKSYVYSLEGGTNNTKLQLPKDERLGLALTQAHLVLQIYVPLGVDFSLDVKVTDLSGSKRHIFLSSATKDSHVTPLHARLPLGMMQRAHWLNMSLNISALVSNVFQATMRSIDLICISAHCKLRKVFTMKHQPYDTTAGIYSPCNDGPNDVIPKACALNVGTTTQVIDNDVIMQWWDKQQGKQRDVITKSAPQNPALRPKPAPRQARSASEASRKRKQKPAAKSPAGTQGIEITGSNKPVVEARQETIVIQRDGGVTIGGSAMGRNSLMDNVEFISTIEIDTPLQSSTPNPPFNNLDSRLSHHTEIPRLSPLNDTSRLSHNDTSRMSHHNDTSRMSHHNDTSRISLNESTRLGQRENSGEKAYREAFPLNEQVLKHERILEDVSRIDPEALNNVHNNEELFNSPRQSALNNVHNNEALFSSPRQSIREVEKPGTRGSVRKSRSKSRNSNSNSSSKSKVYNSRDYEENPFAESDEDLKYRMKALALHNGELDDSFDFSTISSRRSKSTALTPRASQVKEDLSQTRSQQLLIESEMELISESEMVPCSEESYDVRSVISMTSSQLSNAIAVHGACNNLKMLDAIDNLKESLEYRRKRIPVISASASETDPSDIEESLCSSQNSNTLSELAAQTIAEINNEIAAAEILDANNNKLHGSKTNTPITPRASKIPRWNHFPVTRQHNDGADDDDETKTITGSEEGQTIISMAGHIAFDICD